MKTNSLLLILSIVLSLTVSLVGCGPRKNDTPAPGGTADSKAAAQPVTGTALEPAATIQSSDPVAVVLDDIKTLTYEKRDTLTAVVDKMDSQIKAQMAQWTADGRKFPTESATQYQNARDVLTEKLKALTLATPETWSSAKDEAILALQGVRGALHAMDTNAK